MRSVESRKAHHLAAPAAGAARRAALAALLIVAAFPRASRAQVPLPPPPNGTKKLDAPKAAPAGAGQAAPAGGPSATERCTGCHAALGQGLVMHRALEKNDCTACHRAVTNEAGKCKSKTASKWALTKAEPELCYGCHKRKDQQKSVHTAIRQGSCLTCHAPHSSPYPGILREPREKICFDCHEQEGLVLKPVKHAPVVEGRCLDCHDAHGGNLPNNVVAESGTSFCLKCHGPGAPVGRGTPGAGYRIDLGKKVVHGAFKRTDCLGCHDGGHGSDNLKLLKKNAVDLCNGCHERKDKAKHPHTAVVAGDCAVCHDPHSSDQPKLLAKATTQQTCFLCHQDDLTGRKVLHAPIQKGCDQCHDPHGSPNRNGLKVGEGKAGCYKCHKPLDGGKVKHAALERYGCTACHDPHGTGVAALLPKKVNALCVSCHPEQPDGRHVTPQISRGHVVDGLKDPRREGRNFSCASCHNPHGSNSPKMLYYGTSPIESCAWCHGDKSGNRPDLKNVTSAARPKPADTGAGAGGAGGAASGAGAGAAPGGGAGALPGSGAGAPEAGR
ncbi:MAG TPA: cytochrome c3 family protein [Anaeromyxobacter sp.]|nr:cytochrome c3 family protein [Anaeromyxobacter sp.]